MNFRDRVIKSRVTSAADIANDNNELPYKDYKSFGVENVRKIPTCIDLRFENGNRYALPYSHINEINYNKSEGIKIISNDKHISIKGFNLTKMYDYLVSYRIKYIQCVANENEICIETKI